MQVSRSIRYFIAVALFAAFSLFGSGDAFARRSVYSLMLQDTVKTDPGISQEWLDDSLYMSLLELDEYTLFLMDSLEREYILVLGSDLPDEKDIRKAVRQNKKDRRDSIFKNTPRILDTYLIPDSLYYNRLLMWTHSQNTNKINLQKYDTTYNYHFNDLQIYRKDLNAIHLGVAGSPSMSFNYFKREKLKEAPFFEPYLAYSYTPETAVMYNVKTPYTELVYSGTPLSVRTKEDQNVRVLTTMNVTPKLNVKLLYQKYGGAGILTNENSANKNWDVGVDYLGDRYEVHFGFLGQTIIREENGGVSDISMVRDTIIDKKVVPINLSKANNKLKRRTVFLTHSLTVPMNFFRKNRDSLRVGEGTVAYIGHSIEFSTYSKLYTDELTKASERAFYQNINVISNKASNDSISVKRFENKLFINLQPFSKDAILSTINAGIGYQLLGYYAFRPEFDPAVKNTKWLHNTYVYGGVEGKFKKYFYWDARAQYFLSGHYAGDLRAEANLRLSVFPFKDGINLTAHAETATTAPHPFEQYLYFNHHQWDNEFSKSNETKVEVSLDIPHWDLQASVGYAVLSNKIYYDSLTVIRQAEAPVQVFSAYLQKNFKVWHFHFDNRLLFQTSSNEDVLPLPKLSANLRYYIQFPVVKDVMTMQIGANALITSPFKFPGFIPDLGVFYNQSREVVSTNPYIDLFVNMQWKKASIFVKLENVAYGWPQKAYFSANRYIMTDRVLKFGIFWPFY
ncbi:MAG: putative porin [Bacteroidales bacterium]|nr:putative porin [Bacteroidales bacterium]